MNLINQFINFLLKLNYFINTFVKGNKTKLLRGRCNFNITLPLKEKIYLYSENTHFFEHYQGNINRTQVFRLFWSVG